MSNIKKRPKWNKHGVSEIIGNILILGITVTLFSSIMWFVTAMPTPQAHAYADMTSNLSMGYSPSAGGWANISVADKGGQELKSTDTGIYIWINDTTILRYKITDSKPTIGTSWTTGETWQVNITSATFPVGKNPNNAKISLTIIDTVKNSEVYTVTLNSGGALNNPSPPIIGARGTTPSPTYAGDIFFYYATVTDPNNNLNTNSIYLDASSLNPGWASLKMTDSNHDGVFTVQSPSAALLSWNGAFVVVNATDTSGLSITGRITLTILYKSGGGSTTQNYGPYNNYSSYLINGTYPPDANGGESGGQFGASGTTFYYIKEASAPQAITRNFIGGQGVQIQVWSDSLINLALENSFQLINPITGQSITPPSSTYAFGYGGIFATFHEYILNFTAPTSSLIYPFQILLKDNTGTVVSISDYINVNNAQYPILQTYLLNSTTNSLTKTGNFKSTDELVLKIITKDTDSSMLGVYTGYVELMSYTGQYIIKGLPPAATAYSAAPAYTAPLSSLYKTSPGAGSAIRIDDTSSIGVYTLYIKLGAAYQSGWLPLTNAYTLTLQAISDTGHPGTAENYYDITTQINVTAPLTTNDIVAAIGSGSYTWSASGASWSQNSLEWFQGGQRTDQWAETTIDANTRNGPVGLALADVDGNGYNDVIVGWQDQSVSVGWYRNMNPSGTQWSTEPYIIAPAFDAIPYLQAAGGTDHGNANEDVTVYQPNHGGFQSDYYSTNEIPTALATGKFDGLGDTSAVVSFAHPVVYTTATSSGSATGSNSFGMFFNRGIYVYWNIDQGNLAPTALSGTLAYLSGSGDDGANGNYNPAAVDIKCADLNHDGYDDIVAAYNNGTTMVWLNQYGNLQGNNTYRMQNAFGSASLVNNLPHVPGVNPWDNPSGQSDRFAQLRLMDMNNDGYPDIVRTTTVNGNVYILYTQPAPASNPQFPNLESGTYGQATGSINNLTAVDGSYENITETGTTNSATGYSSISTLNYADASPTNPNANSPYFNSGVVQVAKGGTLSVNGFTLNAADSGKIVASASLNLKFIVWPPPASSSSAYPTAESHTAGTATGSMGNLQAVDSQYESLAEQQSATGTIIGTSAKMTGSGQDTTGSTLTNIQTSNDSLYYEIPKSTTMQLSYSMSSAYSGLSVSSASLLIKYYTSGYTTGTNGIGAGNLVWSTDGTTWHQVLLVSNTYSSTGNQYVGTFNLVTAGVNTYSLLNSLQVKFVNGNSGSGTHSVYFDCVIERAIFVYGYPLSWTWTIANNPLYPTAQLTFNGHSQSGSSGFTLSYSVDNSVWQSLGLITATTDQNYVYNLISNTGSNYYVRVTGNDTSQYTFSANMVKLTESGQTGYAGTNDVLVSFNGGATWIDTGVTPTVAAQTWVTSTVNLTALNGGSITYGQLNAMQVKFVNNDPTTPTPAWSVWFDVLNEQVTYKDAMRADWTWQVRNDLTYLYHNLTVSAFCLNSTDSFTVEYSIDGSNWVGQQTISSTSPMTYTWQLPAQTGNYYYVRILNNNIAPSHQTPDMICVDMIEVLHYPSSVVWPSANVVATIPGIGSNQWITSIAVGDIGSRTGNYIADGWPDIVATTSMIGNGNSTNTLYVVYQITGGNAFWAPMPVYTTLLAQNVGNNKVYIVNDIELGDFNGDKNLDIVLCTGFLPAQTGTGVPSLYVYYNEPDAGPAIFQEAVVNALSTSQSTINIQVGNIDLSILMPFLGVVGVVVGESLVERKKRKQ